MVTNSISLFSSRTQDGHRRRLSRALAPSAGANRRVASLAVIGALAMTLAGPATGLAYASAETKRIDEQIAADLLPPIQSEVPGGSAASNASYDYLFSSVNPYFPVLAIPAPAPAATKPEPASESPKPARAIVAGIVHEYDGAPYKWGGVTTSGFDSSGLVVAAYARVGIELPHQSAKIRNSEHTVEISADEAEPGDIIYSPGHVAIYLGDDQQFEAHGVGYSAGVYKVWEKNPVFLRVV